VFFTFGGYSLLTVGCLIGDSDAAPSRKVDKMPWLSILPAAKLQHLAIHDWATVIVCNIELIGRQPSAAFAEFDRDGNRPRLAATDELAKPTPSRNGARDVLSQRLLQEAEHVE
jgi:hypothetical protein